MCYRPKGSYCGKNNKGIKCNAPFYGIDFCVEREDIDRASKLCTTEAMKNAEKFAEKLRTDDNARKAFDEQVNKINDYCAAKEKQRNGDQQLECEEVKSLSKSVGSQKQKTKEASARDFKDEDQKCVTGVRPRGQRSLVHNMRDFLKFAKDQNLCSGLERIGNAEFKGECRKVAINDLSNTLKVNDATLDLTDISSSNEKEFIFGGNGKKGFLERLAETEGGKACPALFSQLANLRYQRLLNDEARCLGSALPNMIKQSAPSFYRALAKSIASCSIEKVSAQGSASSCMGTALPSRKQNQNCQIEIGEKFFCTEDETKMSVTVANNKTIDLATQLTDNRR